nr:hypothetical protein 2 [bacterium]
MATQHGNRAYLQLLLQPFRADLLKELAQERGVRPTALARDLIYDALERELPASVYKEAEAKDAASWKESVRKRVEGRAAAREQRKSKENVESR